MSVIGERGAPVRGLAVLPELSMLVAAHQDGRLRLWPLPRPAMHLLHLATALPATWSLRHGEVRTRHPRLVSLDWCGTRLVTAGGAGDVEVWDVLDLRAQALAQGACFAPLPSPTILGGWDAPASKAASPASVSVSAAAAAAARLPAAAAQRPSPSLPLHIQLGAARLYSDLQRGPASMPRLEPHAAPPAVASLAAAASAAATAASGQPGSVPALQGPFRAALQPTAADSGAGGTGSGGGPVPPTALNCSALLLEYLRQAAATQLDGGAAASGATAAGGGGAGGAPAASHVAGGGGGGTGGGRWFAADVGAGDGGAASPLWPMWSVPHGLLSIVGGGGNLFSVPEEEGMATTGGGEAGGEAGGWSGSGVVGTAQATALLALKGQFLNASDVQLVERLAPPSVSGGASGAEYSLWAGTWRHTRVTVQELSPASACAGAFAALAAELRAYPDATPSPQSWALVEGVQRLGEACQHPSVVRLVGVCLEPPWVVTEHHAGGGSSSLRALMDAARADPSGGAASSLHWMDRLTMLHDIAAGMAFLHDRRYVHGGLVAGNVVVTGEGRAQLGGMGFAQLCRDLLIAGGGADDDAGHNGPASPTHRLAPEAAPTLAASGPEGDVHGFGTLAYELLTCTAPSPALIPRQASSAATGLHNLWSDDRLPQMGYSSGSFNILKELISDCWAPRPLDRPSFAHIVERLRAVLECEQAVLTTRANVAALLAQTGSTQDAPQPLGAEGAALAAAAPADTAPDAVPSRRPTLEPHDEVDHRNTDNDGGGSSSGSRSGSGSRKAVAPAVSSGAAPLTTRTDRTPDDAGHTAPQACPLSPMESMCGSQQPRGSPVAVPQEATTPISATIPGGPSPSRNLPAEPAAAASPSVTAAVALRGPSGGGGGGGCDGRLSPHPLLPSQGPPSQPPSVRQLRSSALEAAAASGNRSGVRSGSGGDGAPSVGALGSGASEGASGGSRRGISSGSRHGDSGSRHGDSGSSDGSGVRTGSSSSASASASGSFAAVPTFDMLIAGASGVQRFTGLPVALRRSHDPFAGAGAGAVGGGGVGAASGAPGGGGAGGLSARGSPGEALLERLAAAGLAEAAAEVLQAVMGPSRRTTAMQTDTGQVILVVEQQEDEAEGGSPRDDATAEAPPATAADGSGPGSTEQADHLTDLPAATPPHTRQSAASPPASHSRTSPSPEGPCHEPDSAGSGGGGSAGTSPGRLGTSAPSFATAHPAARRILGASHSLSRRAASSGSGGNGGVVVALASLQGSGGGGGASSSKGAPGPSNLGKGNLSLKGMSSLAAAVKTFPVEVVSALLSWAPSPGQAARRTYSGHGLPDGGDGRESREGERSSAAA